MSHAPLLRHPVRGVVFDMDGLLVDTERFFRDAMIAEAAALGYDLPLSLFLQLVGVSAESGRKLVRAHFGDAFPLDAWNIAVDRRVREARAAGIALKAR